MSKFWNNKRIPNRTTPFTKALFHTGLTASVYSTLFLYGWVVFALFSPAMRFCAWYAKGKGLLSKSIVVGIILVILAASVKQGISKTERKKKVLSALKTVGIEELAKKKPMHISGGQKQRVAIARAIACGADVVLADEPTGALDSKTGKEIMQIFSELNAAGKTIILITHDRQIASYANRLITIQDGRILNDERI